MVTRTGGMLLLSAAAWLTPIVAAQDAVGPAKADPQLQHRSAEPEKVQAAKVCPKFVDRDWPIHLTIQAWTATLMDSAHLSQGSEVYATVMYPIKYADCALDQNAVIYGHVTGTGFSKELKTSELDLVFDHADCTGETRKEVHFRLIGLIAPAEPPDLLHTALPSEVSGGVAKAVTGGSLDYALSSDFFPTPVHPGLVSRMPKVTLEPEGGPECSAKISAVHHAVQLAPGTALIMTMQLAAQSRK